MSNICNKLSSVFHTKQNLVLKKNTKKVFTNLHCAVLHMHNTSHSHWIWTVIQLDTKCPDKKVFFFFLRKQTFDQAEEGWELHMASE